MSNNLTKFCSQCGNPMNTEQNFCGNCGYQLSINRSKQQRKRPTELIYWMILLIIFVVTISFILIRMQNYGYFRNTRLPHNVSILYHEDETIYQVSKARFPKKLVLGSLGPDEIWCVTYYNSWGEPFCNIAARRGGHWYTEFVSKVEWEIIGCRHEYPEQKMFWD